MLSYLKHGVSNARNQNYLLLIDKIFNELESPMISLQKVSRSSTENSRPRPAIFQKKSLKVNLLNYTLDIAASTIQ